MRLHNRQLKAGFWTDGTLLRWPLAKRLFYAGLVQLADDSGCLEDDAFSFKIQLFPSPMDAEITVEVLEQWTHELVEAGKLVPYTAEGKACLFLKTFRKYQRIDTPSAPEVPLPCWLQWVTYPSNPRAGHYVDVTPEQEPSATTDDVLTHALQPPSNQNQNRNLNLNQNPNRKEVESLVPGWKALPAAAPDPAPLPPPPEGGESDQSRTTAEPAPIASAGADDSPALAAHPHVQRFIDDVWQVHFPQQPLVPGSFAVAREQLDRLEQAVAACARLPGGVAGLFAELHRRLGSQQAALRQKVERDTAQEHWQQRVIPYLAAVIAGMSQDRQSEGGSHHDTTSTGARHTAVYGGNSGPRSRSAGVRLPTFPCTHFTPGVHAWE
ncbi:MAG TPA: hypothetical protein VHV83_19325 [Armatimonadota bacterium]|nr:hypothetical protein [Armatimonadota bacterium]